jgi:hypothetical protein
MGGSGLDSRGGFGFGDFFPGLPANPLSHRCESALDPPGSGIYPFNLVDIGVTRLPFPGRFFGEEVGGFIEGEVVGFYATAS